MPKTSWNDLSVLIHQCKDTLQMAYVIEKQCQKMRERIGVHLEEINKIIEEQEDDEGKTIRETVEC